MKTIFTIALNDLRLLFKERGVWINLVLIPLVISYAVGFANGAANTTAPTIPDIVVDVMDNDNSALSAQLLDEIRAANPALRLCPMDNNDADVCEYEGATFNSALLNDRLSDGVSLALIEIPTGFEAALNNGDNSSIIYFSNEDATAPTFILQAVQAAVQRVGGAQVAARVGLSVADNLDALNFANDAERAAFGQAVFEDAAARWEQRPVTVEFVTNQFDPQQQVERGGGGFSQSIPGMATMYVMFAVLPAMAAFILERKQWTLPRLAAMPISRAQILGGKLLARFAIGMFQYTLIFAFGLLLGVRYGNDPLAVILIMVSYTLCVTALALALTTLLNNEAQAQGIALFLSLTLAPLGGAWWPLEIVPEWMRTVAYISPVAWAMTGYRDLIFHGGSLITILPYVGGLLLITVVLFVFGIVRFRYQ